MKKFRTSLLIILLWKKVLMFLFFNFRRLFLAIKWCTHMLLLYWGGISYLWPTCNLIGPVGLRESQIKVNITVMLYQKFRILFLWRYLLSKTYSKIITCCSRLEPDTNQKIFLLEKNFFVILTGYLLTKTVLISDVFG